MTILGHHTVNEARDLLAVADYRFRETFKAFNALVGMPDDLKADGKALAEKWLKARQDISLDLISAIGRGGLVAPNYVPAEDVYNEILSYIQFGENTKGSLQDVTARVAKLRGVPILYENQPPQNSVDIDLGVFQELDKAIVAAEQGAGEVNRKVTAAATSNTAIILVVAAVGAAITFHEVKKYI